jgi:tRNA pseudouridine55 synthase
MATGVLVVGVNKATRLLTHVVGATKTYEATIRLGENTTTDDAEGEILQRRYVAAVTRPDLDAAVETLTGDIEQVPSSVSAIKVDGKRSYQRVRDGETVELPARPVTVSRFDILDVRRPEGGRTMDVDVVVDCSSGTYIRALARDLGESLAVGGHLTALRRTRVGAFDLGRARTLEQLGENFQVVPLSDAARGLFPARELNAEEAREIGFGRRIVASGSKDLTAGFGPDGQLVALLKDRGANAKPELVFAPR